MKHNLSFTCKKDLFSELLSSEFILLSFESQNCTSNSYLYILVTSHSCCLVVRKDCWLLKMDVIIDHMLIYGCKMESKKLETNPKQMTFKCAYGMNVYACSED